MACGNNNNRGGNLGGLKNILDFNVTYTGCETSCGGREIKTGDSLRNVLDALVANCDGGSGPVGSSTNFWFSRNVPTFTVDVKENDFALTGSGAIYEFVDGEWQNTGIQIGGSGGGGDSVWGSITGAIADQTDLTEYINLLITESPLSIDKFGENFHKKEGDEKVQNGRYVTGLDEFKYLHFGVRDIEFPADLELPGFLIAGEGSEEFISLGSLGRINIISEENTEIGVRNGNLIINSPNGRIISTPIEIEPFPANPQDNYAATVGYVKSMINALQNTIDAQATQIADLTSRIEALENA